MFDETARFSPNPKGVAFAFDDGDGEPCVGWVAVDALAELMGRDLSPDEALAAYRDHFSRIHAIVERKIARSQGSRVFVEDLFGA
ncbi:DUF1488 family protein [Bordetella genomosp. 12]|uniref:DUF1488 domain-containing protein n=1 Tax=Bordetella genomosp. 12 TaxID=463035 RepID=A0A261VK26_9BORD|nr:DUF1488 family protein [Bordetella genomosp. 12]OZI74494.1 hypothetical protein CAL22_08485 [Bordetella genomosp. 12]